jgi:ketosteroid isomerase-like protein
MSEENVEIVRRAVEAFNRGDFEGVTAEFAPEFEYVASGVIPGVGGVYRAPQGYTSFMEAFWGEFDELGAEVNELIDAGDRVLLSLTVQGRGKQSGVETAWDFWQVYAVRDSMVVRGQGYMSRDEALEAAGLEE